MSHEGGPEQPQRTVAELLAKYGAESGERTPRRRRRRADDMEDTGAQAIIERVLSESGEMQAIREDTPPPERTSHRRGAADYRRQPPPLPQAPAPSPSPQPRRRDQSSQSLPRPLPQQPSQQLPRPQPQPGPPPGGPVGPPSIGRMPAISRPSEPTTPVHGGPPRTSLPPRQQPSQQLPRPVQPGNRTGVQPTMRSRLEGSTEAAPPPPPPPPKPAPPIESVTEELPRVPGRIPVDGSGMGRRPGLDSRTHLTPPPYPPPHDPYAEPEEDDYRDPYQQAEPGRGYEPDAYDSAEYDNFLDEDELADDGRAEALDDVDDDLDDEDTERSPAKEWGVMAGQLALGVLGGAAVWLGFNWLWGFLPQAALVVALAVIVGLVLILRKIRKAEDLQTTVLAVLVGLVATVSPAALLLLNK